jgi:hypothetical protein
VNKTILTRERHYPGEDVAEPLIPWLNQTPDDDPGKQRIATLIKTQAELQREANEERRITLLTHNIIDQVDWYRRWPFRPRFDGGRHEFDWTVTWEPRDEYLSEGEALNAFLQLHDMEEDWRLRRCQHEECRLWYYAHRKKQKYCSDNCQLDGYRSSEKGIIADRRHQHDSRERMKQGRRFKTPTKNRRRRR